MKLLGTIAVVGNPNTGKTTLFNNLTGLNQRIGNYPGVTVESKIGTLTYQDKEIHLKDLPGTYSLSAHSLDERIVVDTLAGHFENEEEKISGILMIADASNLQRNLYLYSQLAELNLPIILALNMIDIAEKNGIEINHEKLVKNLKVPIVFVQAKSGKGIEELTQKLFELLEEKIESPQYVAEEAFNPPYQEALIQLREVVPSDFKIHPFQLERALIDQNGYYETKFSSSIGDSFQKKLNTLRSTLEKEKPLSSLEAQSRYQWIETKLQGVLTIPKDEKQTFSDKLDSIVTHKVFGVLIFLGVMIFLFQSIYTWSGPLMDFVDETFGSIGDYIGPLMPEGALKSLVVDGIIAGVGGVIIFLPQILILFLFIAILEDCGYMARAAYLMDKLMSKFGLSGKSFIPMLSSFACAIPGVMATRVIEDKRDRFTTILVAPLMSCSARLPVYTILIAAFIPNTTIFGFLNLKGLVLFGAYSVGMITAILVAFTLKKTIFKGEASPFVMELPSYKFPSFRTITMRIYNAGAEFLRRAGTIIFAITLIIWALAYYPRSEKVEKEFSAKIQQEEQDYQQTLNTLATQSALAVRGSELLNNPEITSFLKNYTQKLEQIQKLEEDEEAEENKLKEAQAELKKFEESATEANPKLTQLALAIYNAEQTKNEKQNDFENQKSSQYLENSFLAIMGKTLQPLFKPLGWDWKIATATIASFPAREVIVATLGTIYSLGSEVDENSKSLQGAMKSSTYSDGTKVFNIPVALSIMVFFALCAQCGATLAIIKRETNSWKWPVFTFVYMTGLAYIGALATYQIGMLF